MAIGGKVKILKSRSFWSALRLWRDFVSRDLHHHSSRLSYVGLQKNNLSRKLFFARLLALLQSKSAGDNENVSIWHGFS